MLGPPTGRTTEAQNALLTFRGLGPWWVPREFPFDVYAALSQIRRPPSEWRNVEVHPVSGNEPWTLVVHFKTERYPQEVEIPGGGRVGSGARDVLDLLKYPGQVDMNARQRREWGRFSPEDVEVFPS